MPITPIKTKVILPPRRGEIIPRKRLLDLMEEQVQRKLVVVTAPAGYGKTSLLVDFAHRSELPVCWYALDTLDSEIERFVAHLIASLQQQFPEFGDQSLAALNAAGQTGLDLDHLATTMVNEIYDHVRGEIIIILDDYHLVFEQGVVDKFVNLFAYRVGENCHLVLASRSLISLDDLALMVARSQVGGLSQAELAFTAEEIKFLILRNYNTIISDSESETLAQATEGWITALLLSAQTMWQGMADRIRLARASGIDLYEYLAQQIFRLQPDEIQDFLLRTALLEEFDAALCATAFGDEQPWQEHIDTVLQNNLLVIPFGDNQQWIRYHHLFRDFLQSHLKREDPARFEAILHRLVEVFSNQADWEKAYELSLRLEDPPTTIRLVERAGSPLIKNGRWALLDRWIENIPDEQRASHPVLISFKGTILSIQGNPEKGLKLLDQADELLSKTPDVSNLCANLVRRADINRLVGSYHASIRDASKAIALSQHKPKMRSWYAGALRALGMDCYQLGKLQKAIEYLSQSLEVYAALKDEQLQAMLRMELGLAFMNAGQFSQALENFRLALKFWRESNDPTREATILYNTGVIYRHRGEYDQALALYEEGLERARRAGYVRMETFLLIGIGDVYADLGASESALEAFRQAKELALETENRLLIHYLNLVQANLFRLKDDFAKSRELLESAVEVQKESSSAYEKGLWHLEMGKLSLASGELDPSKQHFTKAGEIFASNGQTLEACQASLYLAQAYFQGSEPTAARQALQKGFDLQGQIEDSNLLVITGKEIVPVLQLGTDHAATRHKSVRMLNRIKRFEAGIPVQRRRMRLHIRSVPFVPPKLFIRALGESQVELDGEVIQAYQWTTQKTVRELFFLLLSHRDGMAKEEIGAILFPESSPDHLKNQFKNLVYRLRIALGKDTILHENERYYFNPDLDFVYDVDLFSREMRRARDTKIQSQKLEAYQAALDLYRGAYLADLDATWVMADRQRFAAMHIEAMTEVARIYLEAKKNKETLRLGDRILEEDPCFEEAHRIKMFAFAALGDRAGIKRQYETCRRILWQEIQTPPSPQTESLYFKLTQ